MAAVVSAGSLRHNQEVMKRAWKSGKRTDLRDNGLSLSSIILGVWRCQILSQTIVVRGNDDFLHTFEENGN